MRMAEELQWLGVGPRAGERTRALATLSAFVALGATLRFVGLGEQSFWYDEAFSAELARAPALDLATGLVRDLGNPPLHPILLGLWSQVFGSGDVALRAFSALAGALAIPVLWLVAKRLVPSGAALLATFLFAISPLHVGLAQEARAFSLVTLLGLLSVHALLRAVDRPRSTGRWLLYAIFTFGALYAHYYALFLVLSHLLLLWSLRAAKGRVVSAWIGALGIAAVLYASWIPAFIAQASHPGNLARAADTWAMHVLATPLAFVAGTTLLWKGTDLTGPGVALALPGVLAALAAGVVAIGQAVNGRAPTRRAFAWLLPPLLVPVVVSLAIAPLYTVRYVALAAPAFYLVIALGLIGLRRWARVLAITGLVVTAAAAITRAHVLPLKHEWRRAAAFVEARAKPDDLLVFEADFSETAFVRYGNGAQPRIRAFPPPEGTTEETVWGSPTRGAPPRDMTPALAAAQRVWVILSDPPPGADDRWARRLAGWKGKADERFRGIRVQLFSRDAARPTPAVGEAVAPP
jgi:mannosyltransferase